MLDDDSAQRIALAWLEAWNARDLDRILEHYGENIEFLRPFAVKLAGDPAGAARGKAALREYFSRALAAYPDLHFRLHKVLTGVRSFTIYYESVDGLTAAETMEVDDAGRVVRVLAHYAPK